MTPVIGDLIESTVGKVVGKLADHYLPSTMGEAEKAEFKLKARELAIQEAESATKDVENARALAAKESEGAPPWANVLKVTHRPLWSFVVLAIVSWTILAPYFGYPQIPLTDAHKSIIQTVIVFYFGGRSVEKGISIAKGKGKP